ncbi:hypothetical protein BZG36_03044 [Bifiguratus adelaidae]|uniref:CSC1/OSCA1-like 7TM region domain-containing protein n=1 Tax=Bifiguratus adelaidae TaxID=1938954 RepID=A0A261XYY5_9FUNG|nr:hypothetical protein BZG36_03044 [Bifiguratus adelaidae]
MSVPVTSNQTYNPLNSICVNPFNCTAGNGNALPGTAQWYSANASPLVFQFVLCVSVGTLLLLGFSFCRTRYPAFFAARLRMKSRAPEPLPKSFLGWIGPLLRMDHDEVLDKVGLDAVVFLSFLWMGAKLYGIFCVGSLMLIPFSIVASTNQTTGAVPPDAISFTAVDKSSSYLIAWLVFTWIYTFIVYGMLWLNYRDFVAVRRKYLLKLSQTVRARTVLVTNIPRHLRSDQALAEWFENLGIGRVESSHIVRHVGRLKDLVGKRVKYLRKLEDAYSRAYGNPSTSDAYEPEFILDQLEYAQSQWKELYNDNVHRLGREKVLEVAKSNVAASEGSKDTQIDMTTIVDSPGIQPSTVTRAPENSVLSKALTSSITREIRKRSIKSVQVFKQAATAALLNAADDVELEHTNMDKLPHIAIPEDPHATSKIKRPQVHTGLWGIFGEKVEAIDYYTYRFIATDARVIEARHSIDYQLSSVGFVTFESAVTASLVSQSLLYPEPFQLNVKEAPEPRDVYWPNITLSTKSLVIRHILVDLFTVALAVFWVVPISFFAIFFSRDFLRNYFPSAMDKVLSIPILEGLVQGTLQPLATVIFMALLPLIFDALGRVQGWRSRSELDESMMRNYFSFLLFNVLLVFTVASSIWQTIVDLYSNPSTIPNLLAHSLPQVGPYFINYTILQGLLLVPLQLILPGQLFYKLIFHPKTPRGHSDLEAPWQYSYGWSLPVPLLVFIICLVYSTISPLIVIFGMVFFFNQYIVAKYLLLYVYFQPYDSAGKCWPMIFNRILAGMVIYQLLMAGLFLLTTNHQNYVLGVLCVPLIFFTVIFKWLVDRAFRKNSRNVPINMTAEWLKEHGSKGQLSQEKTEADRASRESAAQVATSKDVEQDSDGEEQFQVFSEPTPKSTTKSRGVDFRGAALAVLATERFSAAGHERPKSSNGLVRRRTYHGHRLDMDDYEAQPTKHTDFREPPMILVDGVLYTGTKRYGNPALVGVLPQLWLPLSATTTSGKPKANWRSAGRKLKRTGATLLQTTDNVAVNPLRKVLPLKLVRDESAPVVIEERDDTPRGSREGETLPLNPALTSQGSFTYTPNSPTDPSASEEPLLAPSPRTSIDPSNTSQPTAAGDSVRIDIEPSLRTRQRSFELDKAEEDDEGQDSDSEKQDDDPENPHRTYYHHAKERASSQSSKSR